MTLAVDAAWAFQGLTFPNPAVGACVVDSNGSIVAVAAHQQAGGPHAEVFALQQAYARLSGDDTILALGASAAIHNYFRTHHDGIFFACSIYVTLEPCAHQGKTPACAGLLRILRPDRVVIAEADPHPRAAGGAALLRSAGIDVHFVTHPSAKSLLAPFVKWQTAPFVTFKWAQRLDGTIDGGIISSEGSRRRVHAMRDVCDLLVIGGNTVRTDRPTLDARMVQGRAPDVLIVSRSDTFDRTIPLFHVSGRQVFIEHDFSRIGQYRNVLIEGGPTFFALARAHCDLFLCFVAPGSGGATRFLYGTESFEIVHHGVSGGDVMLWMGRDAL